MLKLLPTLIAAGAGKRLDGLRMGCRSGHVVARATGDRQSTVELYVPQFDRALADHAADGFGLHGAVIAAADRHAGLRQRHAKADRRDRPRPGNVLILADGASDEVMSNLTSTELSDIENEPAVLRDKDGPIATRETYLVVNQPILNAGPGKPKRRFLQMRGLGRSRARGDGPRTDVAGTRRGQVVLRGGRAQADRRAARGGRARHWPSRPCSVKASRASWPATARRSNWPSPRTASNSTWGDLFTLGDRAWVVAGIMSSSGSTFNSEVWARRQLIGPLFGKENYTSMIVRTADDAAAADFCDFLKEKYSKAAVAARVETDYYASLSDTNKQFLVAIIFVTVVMSIGGVLGVMNTMFAAISQRIKDIGVLRLLGYSRRHILVALLLESLLIALVGGLLGCLLGSFRPRLVGHEHRGRGGHGQVGWP